MKTFTMYSADQIREAAKDSIAAAGNMIAANMENSDKWLIRGLLAIYNHQTPDEQRASDVKWNNLVGFNSADGVILSRYAQYVLQFQSGKGRYDTPLLPSQMRKLRQKMTKYSKQLAKIVANQVEVNNV